MPCLTNSILLLCLLVAPTFAQQTTVPPATQTASPNSSQVQLDATLQRYLGAYQHKSVQELLAVWPNLQSQKKEYEKIKRHLEDGNVSEEQLTLQPLQTESNGNDALVHAQRTEQYVKTERSSSITHGDLNMGNMPVQDPGPSQLEKKKPFKKSDTVWIMLHRAGDSWTIVSIGEQKPQ